MVCYELDEILVELEGQWKLIVNLEKGGNKVMNERQKSEFLPGLTQTGLCCRRRWLEA